MNDERDDGYMIIAFAVCGLGGAIVGFILGAAWMLGPR